MPSSQALSPAPPAIASTGPSIEEEEDSTPAPASPQNPANSSYNKSDFLMPQHACTVQQCMGEYALLAWGLEDIYSVFSGKYLMMSEVFEHALAANSNIKDPKSFWEAMQPTCGTRLPCVRWRRTLRMALVSLSSFPLSTRQLAPSGCLRSSTTPMAPLNATRAVLLLRVPQHQL
jgi:hypothetical protein